MLYQDPTERLKKYFQDNNNLIVDQSFIKQIRENKINNGKMGSGEGMALILRRLD
jgi:hypothetical protein